MGDLNSWKPQGLSRAVQGLLYLISKTLEQKLTVVKSINPLFLNTMYIKINLVTKL